MSPIPSQAEYERQSRDEAFRREIEIERAPLSDRKVNARKFFELMRYDPALVAERVGWIIDGSYGYGEMMKAKQIVANPRMNRVAALNCLIALYEWQCPRRLCVEAWKKLTTAQKNMLDKAIEVVIKAAEKTSP